MTRETKTTRHHDGSTLDSLLAEDRILEEVEAVAIKRVIAWQLAQFTTRENITKKAMAERMHTSRSQLDRLLDPDNGAINLETVARAAKVVGKRIRLELVDAG